MNCVCQHCQGFTRIVKATIPSQPSAVYFEWSIQSLVRILHSSLSICTYLLPLLLEFLTGIFMLKNCYCYFFHSLLGDFWVCSWYRQGDDIYNSASFRFYVSVIISGIIVSSTRRYLCHVWWTTACSRHSKEYRRLDGTCMPAALLLLCFWIF